MIATILQSSPTFNAVYYNEQKVKDGAASLLEIKNFGHIETFGYNSPTELVDYLKDYSSRNDRIKKPQFHVAISCRGNEMSEEELLSFAHDYLKEMGYGEPDQPLLIYSHRDTDNNHLHIITSRVGPDGKKIDDHHERRRSQVVLERLEKRDVKKKVKEDITAALGFNFRNVSQFRALMEAMNYECFTKGETVYIKKGGMIQDTLNLEIVNAAIRKNLLIAESNLKPRYGQLWGIFKKYKNLNSSRAGFEKDLKKKFGVSLVFFGSKDSPYGYSVIDFNNKIVLEGSKVMKVKELLTFLSPEEHRKQIEALIDLAFQENPFITTKELNQRLFKIGAYVKKGEIIVGNNKIPINDIFGNQLKRNNLIQRLNSFKPRDKTERDIICKLTKFSDHNLINIEPQGNSYTPAGLDELRTAYALPTIEERKKGLEQAGFILVRHDNRLFAYNSRLSSIIDIERAGFPTSTREEIIQQINDVLEKEPFATAYTVNKHLLLTGARINKSEIEAGDERFSMDDKVVAQLKRNGMIQFINSFNPRDEVERDVICTAFRFKEPDLISMKSETEVSDKPKGIEELKKILAIDGPMDILRNLEYHDFNIVCQDGKHYAFNPKLKTIFNLEAEGCPVLKMETVMEIISGVMKENPNYTTFELNRKLNKIGASVKKGELSLDDRIFNIDKEVVAQLAANDKISLINSFNPSTLQEKEILCKIFSLPETEAERVVLSCDENYTPKGIKDLEEIFKIPNILQRNYELQDQGYRIERKEGVTYAVHINTRSIINLDKYRLHGLRNIDFADILKTIQGCVAHDPYVNTHDLNRELFAIGAYISKDMIHFGDETYEVPEDVKVQLKRNNMIDWLNSFNPTTEEERHVICKITGFTEPNLIRLDTQAEDYCPNGLNTLKDVIAGNNGVEPLNAIQNAGFQLIIHNNTLYALNFELKSVIDMSKIGIKGSLYQSLYKSCQRLPQIRPDSNITVPENSHGAINKFKAAMGARGSEVNREWEVGKRGIDKDDQDRNNGYSY